MHVSGYGGGGRGVAEALLLLPVARRVPKAMALAISGGAIGRATLTHD